jgi:5-histidylcysteine sulfoxide synthase/putative 4-mercaptohistidine N1-methyltranferase
MPGTDHAMATKATRNPTTLSRDGQQISAASRPLHSLPQLNLQAGRAAVLAYFENTWALTECLFAGLTSEAAFLVRPYHKTRHPLIFYYTHPVCFYVNKLLVSGLIDEPVNPAFELLFETGVDEMNWDDLHEGKDDIWPSLEAVKAYRQQVYDLVKGIIQSHPCLDDPITIDSPAWALAMAFEHERIHLETSSVLMRELPLEYVRTPPNWPALSKTESAQIFEPAAGDDYPRNSLIKLASTAVTLGKPADWPSFGWDNEYGHDERDVPAFKASRYLISNGEFHEFVRAGGYEQAQYWSEQGWRWRQFRNVKWPTFWVQAGPAGSHRYKLRTTFTEVPMQWSWPAVVNYYEAKAYCNWRSERDGSAVAYRLPHEAEHLAMRAADQRHPLQHDTVGNPVLTDWSMSRTPQRLVNHNLKFGSEGPVDACEANELGMHDTLGNVWQWCEDTFHPLADFAFHPYYTDFSTPCFDNEHQMILGGSFVSTGDEASMWARFHFRPHFFQHAGFRIVQETASDAKSNKYETSELVNQYLLFHFGSDAEQRDTEIAQRAPFPSVSNLIERTVELMNEYSQGDRSALDLGCAVARSSFELARTFTRVIGIDYSEEFIRVANQLKQAGELSYRRRETGRHMTELKARIATEIDRSRIEFLQGDASRLHAIEQLGNTPSAPFDAILLSNLLCRLEDPEACLHQFVHSDRWLARGGILVLASPNTWMTEYTRTERFLDGQDSTATLAAIGNRLQGFTLLHEEDCPFMIREHRRKYEYIVSQVSVWRKQT